jgi:photosystem II stability/assembly factor-like uncharacterized protein
MRRKHVVLVLGCIVACAGAGAVALSTVEPESLRHASSSVREVLFLGDSRVLLSNERGQTYLSDSSGRSWEEVANGVSGLTVADSSEVWGCHGWPGHHEGPSATIWHSSDAGREWSRTEISLPNGSGYSPEVVRRLPAVFLNEPHDPPLLLMHDFQLVQPHPGTDPDSWTRIGTRVPVEALPRSRNATGVRHGSVIYIAASGRLLMSTDAAQSWVDQPTHPFFDARFSCGSGACFALLSETGSEWAGLVTTSPGAKDWTPFGTLELEAVRNALAEQARIHGAIESFGATAFVRAEQDVLVSGIVNAGTRAWGAVVVVPAKGPLRSLPGSVLHGLWGLARDPRGRLWAAGIGAFVHSGATWKQVWSAAT